MTSRRRVLSYILFLIGILLLTGSVLYYFHTRPPISESATENVPETLAGLPLVQVVTGQEAIDSIHQLHGRDFPLAGGAVAVYGNQNAILWVSDAGSDSEAFDLIELMSERIAEGNSPFVELGDFELDGQTVYVLDNAGQAHYFWQIENLVLWLAAEVSVAQQAIIECVAFYR